MALRALVGSGAGRPLDAGSLLVDQGGAEMSGEGEEGVGSEQEEGDRYGEPAAEFSWDDLWVAGEVDEDGGSEGPCHGEAEVFVVFEGAGIVEVATDDGIGPEAGLDGGPAGEEGEAEGGGSGNPKGCQCRAALCGAAEEPKQGADNGESDGEMDHSRVEQFDSPEAAEVIAASCGEEGKAAGRRGEPVHGAISTRVGTLRFPSRATVISTGRPEAKAENSTGWPAESNSVSSVK